MKIEYSSDAYNEAKALKSCNNTDGNDIINKYLRDGELLGNDVEKLLKEKISAAIQDFENAEKDIQKGLKESIHDSVFINSCVTLNEYKTLYRLRDMIRSINKEYSRSDLKNDWRSAVEAAKDYNLLKGELPRTDKKDRSWDTSITVKKLSRYNVNFDFHDGRYYIKDEGLVTAKKLLEDTLQEIGGSLVVDELFKYEVRSSYSNKARRFIHRPENAKSSISIERNAVPSNLILNIALKNIIHKEKKKNPLVETSDLVSFNKFRDICTLISRGFDCEIYSCFEILQVPADKLAKFLLDGAIYSNVHEFVQMDPELALRILNKVSDNYGDILYGSLKIKDICDFTDRLIHLAQNEKAIYLQDQVLKRSSFFKNTRNLMKIKSVMAIGNDEINKDYSLPGNNSNYLFYPIIKTKNNKNCILPKSIAANSSVERVFSIVRKTSAKGHFENEFGKGPLEEILREMHYDMLSIPVLQGNTVESNETDGIIETNNEIHIFECKMKALIQLSRSGDDVGLISDLVKSLLYSQSQMMDIEIALRKKGSIVVKDVKGHKKIDLLDRKVKRHSIVLHDYGILQNKNFILNFMLALVNNDFMHPDKEKDKILKNLDCKIERFRRSCKLLYELEALPSHNPFHESSFLNFSDLHCMLSMSNDRDHYYKLLNSVDVIMYGTSPPIQSVINLPTGTGRNHSST